MFDESLIEEKETVNFVIQKENGYNSEGQPIVYSKWINKANPSYDIRKNFEHEGKVFAGDCDPCNDGSYSNLPAIYNSFNWSTSTVLIMGLYLGVLPQYIMDNKSPYILDVIDSDQDLVDTVTWIDSNINVIKSHPYAYEPDKKYDIIICDLWCSAQNITENHETTLWNIYKDHLNANGKIVIPVANKTLN